MQQLVALLKEDNVNTQLEAAWCLNNIAGGTDEHAMSVLEAAGDSLITLLSSGDVPLEVCCSRCSYHRDSVEWNHRIWSLRFYYARQQELL